MLYQSTKHGAYDCSRHRLQFFMGNNSAGFIELNTLDAYFSFLKHLKLAIKALVLHLSQFPVFDDLTADVSLTNQINHMKRSYWHFDSPKLACLTAESKARC